MSSYLTIVEAQAYYDTRLGTSPWDIADQVNRNKSLLMSTSIIDRLKYLGARTDITQTNQFPRSGELVVPQAIKDATAEIALALLDGFDLELEYENLNMVSQSFGKLKSTYDRSIIQEYKLAGVPSITAWRLLKPYLYDQLTVDLHRVS